MRHFIFDLRLPDGREVTTEVTSESWQWHAAYSQACAQVERAEGIPPASGIVCLGYESEPDPFAAAAA